jgi:hypothetical protein
MIKTGLIILIFFLELNAFSQSEKPPLPAKQPTSLAKDFETFKDRLYFGGNFGGIFGNITYVNLSPFIGCKLTKEFSIGGGITYNYYSQTYGAKKYTSYIYGTNAFARYTILENLFAQVGWDRLNIADYTSPILNSRVWIDNILVGGGYKQAVSERSYFSAAIFYNINQTPLSPYPNPIFQIGINVGF